MDSQNKPTTPVTPPEAIVLMQFDGKELIKDADGNWSTSETQRIVVRSIQGIYHIFNKQAQEWHPLSRGLTWGKAVEDIPGQTRQPRQVRLYGYAENGPEPTDGGNDFPAVDEDDAPIYFYTIDRVIPTDKKVPVNGWVGCDQIGPHTFCIAVCDCPVAI